MKEKIILQLKWDSLLLVLLALIWWLSAYSGLVERFYSGKLFPVYSIIAQTLTVWIPLSLGDYLYVLLIAIFFTFFVKIVLGVFKRNYLLSFYYVLKAIKAALFLAICFYSFWGMNYFRLPLETRMGLNMEVSAPCELLETTAICIDRANLFRKKLKERDLQMADEEIFRKAEALVSGNSSLQPYLFSYLPTVKRPVTNLFVNYTGIAGYFNPFTQEAQVNTSMPIFSKPFTACHELGHQAGIGFEDEANLIGFILCTESEDALFQYAAYYNAAFILLKQLAFQDGGAYLNMLKLVDPIVLKDAKEEERYWMQFDGILNHASAKFYNGYLQFNNQPEGLKRYSRMTKLLIAWRGKNKSGF